MAHDENEIPPIPVPPIEPAPAAARPLSQKSQIGVQPPLVEFAGVEPAVPEVARPDPTTQPASSAQPDPYAQPNPYAQPDPSAQPNPYVQPNPYAQPSGAYTQPNPYAAPATPAYYPSAYPAGTPYASGQAAPSSGLAVVSMVLGIVGFLFNGFFGFGFLLGVGAIVTGHLAQKRQPHAKALWITGLITGYIAAVAGLLIGIFWIIYLVSY